MNVEVLTDLLRQATHAAAFGFSAALSRRWAASIAIDPDPWLTLTKELDIWQGQKRHARFWLRDDDAIAPTRALSRLLETQANFCIPLALAVIPANAEASLATCLNGVADIVVLQHGWSHTNHAHSGEPSSEFPRHRDEDHVSKELRQGHERMRELFGRRYLPVLVPPFNHITRRWTAALESIGFWGVSINGDFCGLNIATKNVHLDVINWKARDARASTQIVRAAVAALRLRRYGLIAEDEPIGILTHHLDHTESIWQLTRELLKQLTDHPAACFPQLTKVFSDEHPETPPNIVAFCRHGLQSAGARGGESQ